MCDLKSNYRNISVNVWPINDDNSPWPIACADGVVVNSLITIYINETMTIATDGRTTELILNGQCSNCFHTHNKLKSWSIVFFCKLNCILIITNNKYKKTNQFEWAMKIWSINWNVYHDKCFSLNGQEEVFLC